MAEPVHHGGADEDSKGDQSSTHHARRSPLERRVNGLPNRPRGHAVPFADGAQEHQAEVELRNVLGRRGLKAEGAGGALGGGELPGGERLGG